MNSTPSRAWLVWGVAVAAYLLAIFHRSSLAVAGLVASDRFGISASQLATFTMLQLLIYAAMQMPVGLLADRFGPRRVLSVGTIVMALGQIAFAFADTYPAALVARGFVGMGDAMTFICVLRLASTWFPARRIPLISQLTGSAGQVGAIMAAIPMSWALGYLGWTWAYLTAALASLALLLVVFAVVHDTPDERAIRGHPLSARTLAGNLRTTWAQPGTRLGFWVHFSTPFSVHAFALLWGFPFLVRAQGLSETAAGALLSVAVVATICAGPIVGWATGYRPFHRSSVALGAVIALSVTWAAVLAWPGEAPRWLLVVLVLVLGVGGPASMIGFDVGRTSNPGARYATASGIINQGGFVAALITVVAIGLILDWRTPGGSTNYTPEAFRWAMSFQFVLFAVGGIQIWRYRRRVRRQVPRSIIDGGSTVVEF